MKERVWITDPAVPDEARAAFPDVHPVALRLLWNRGVRTQAEMDVFLGPDWSRDAHSPSMFRNMQAAVERVFAALEAGERITVHGDYDADGVCGTTVLMSTLCDICRSLGGQGPQADKAFRENPAGLRASTAFQLSSYIPHREKEGYGLSVATMEKLAAEGTKLVITVDCGISNKDAIDRGRELGVDTIVCDHHAVPDALPDAAILLHPQVPGETYPNKTLCGTGVAFKLASALIHEASKRGASFAEGYEKWLLDLVAIATVTDVMPLMGENRVLETYGLKVLNKTRRVGIQKLLEAAGNKGGELDTVTIGFQIGPRLNAAGRMEHARGAVELLLEEDPTRAAELAMRLNEVNADRQKASEAMYQEAKRLVGDPGDTKCVIVSSAGWSPGLVGLVAGKLVNDFCRPVYAVGKDGERYVGSGRSFGGFDVTAALHACKEHLDRFGGHPQACGFSVSGEERFAFLVESLHKHADAHIKPDDLRPILRVDADLDLEDVDWALLEAVQKLEPFGEKNPRPLFASRATVVAFDTVGADGKHLRLSARGKGGRIAKFIGFRFGEWVKRLKPGQALDVAFELGVNEWKGNRELQLRIVDLKA
ncbi:single-stranded-DNA-specific exonuclease RecJ [Patescibacteria group bacterium]|nr:MAG: single-stranded-DNA-specific exonuclease RecJ [Patescibacteria group bacterium]